MNFPALSITMLISAFIYTMEMPLNVHITTYIGFPLKIFNKDVPFENIDCKYRYKEINDFHVLIHDHVDLDVHLDHQDGLEPP